ncbi:hypothetical protein ABZ697_27655 [Streptomyces albidoflavus]|uniref:hypothetical protein n=1 Tax=Streptomyces albidoflavus TaxID=1886 RepID=UPI0033D83A58
MIDLMRGIDRADWAAMVRMHESAHVTASEALGIPVVDVWANVSPAVAHGGQFRNGPGDSQHQSVVFYIGAEGGAEELRRRGYSPETALTSIDLLGYSDREIVRTEVVAPAAEQGWRIDPEWAHEDAQKVLASPGFWDTAQNVAEAMSDRGDRLTGADVRAAMGSYQLSSDLWIPTSTDIARWDRDRDLDHEIDL